MQTKDERAMITSHTNTSDLVAQRARLVREISSIHPKIRS